MLGGSHCIAAHPGDMPVALLALDAEIVIHGPTGDRNVPVDSFYRLPGGTPHIQTDLKPGELIAAAVLPPAPAGGMRYLKVRERNSYAFALASVAAIIDIGDDRRIRAARFALGGVATKPRRVRSAEESLGGKAADEAAFHSAAGIALRAAQPHRFNAFKVELARRTIVRALMDAGADCHSRQVTLTAAVIAHCLRHFCTLVRHLP